MSSSTAVASAQAADLTIDAQSKTGHLKVSATENVWSQFLGWWERGYRMTLDWMAAHPILTVVIALVITFWRWQAHLTKVELARQKAEFASARASARKSGSPQKGRGAK